MEVHEPKQNWGGAWTEKKLDAFSKYVWSYLTIMKKNTNWKTIYFDGFAGSGNRGDKSNELLEQLSILPEEEKVYKGAAERVLKVRDSLSFDFYYFIDTKKSSLEKLESQLIRLPEANGKKLLYRHGDANKYLFELSAALKGEKPTYAALILLDPFGMQINWDSIASLQGTHADTWILIPTGVIVNRLLDKKGELPNLEKLKSFFGLSEEEIRNHFYKIEKQQTLFGETEMINKVVKPIRKIADLYIRQLKTIWKHVTTEPLTLYNSRNVPIFHFVFAANNPIALKIAKQIIKTT